MTKAQLRTKVLTAVGRSWPMVAWAKGRCRRSGVRTRSVAGAVQLRKENRAILLAPKHVFFATEVAAAFDAYAHALPAEHAEGVSTVNFAINPDAFNICRQCLSIGVSIRATEQGLWLCQGNRAMVLAQHHFVYAPTLASQFDSYFAPLVPKIIDGMEVLDFSRPGILQTYKNSGLEFEMASFPEEEDAIFDYFRWYRPKPGDTVFDLGAHCGVSVYHLSKLVGPEGRVIAFEPDPGNFAILQRNIKRHELSNVTAENVAIAGAAGKLAFNSEGTVGSSLVSLLGRPSVGSVAMVDCLTLSDVFERWGVPAFCKIDIEGAEVEVIEASAELLKRHKTNFAIDTHHPKANGQMTDVDMETMFKSYGYEVLSESNPFLTTWARPK